MSNSDDKLDALYGREHEESPKDLNELISAAAKAATRSESDSVSGDTAYDESTAAPRESSGWHKKAGWASAAVVMLTSLLFLGLPDRDNWQPRSELAGAATRVDDAVSAPAPAPKPVPAPAPAAEQTRANRSVLADTAPDVTTFTASAERATAAEIADIANTEAADYAPSVPQSPALGTGAISRNTTELPPAAFRKSNGTRGATLASQQTADLMDSVPPAAVALMREKTATVPASAMRCPTRATLYLDLPC